MGNTSIDIAYPIARAMSGDDHSVCPECNHERMASRFHFRTLFARLFGLRPPRAVCEYMLASSESGDGLPGYCYCRLAFHVS
jgi:hypothetical protein